MAKEAKTTCPICFRSVAQNVDNGRPKVYCSERCKGKAKRRAMRDRDRRAILGVSGQAEVMATGTQEPVYQEGAAVTPCHLCGRHPATRGSPPLLCDGCARN